MRNTGDTLDSGTLTIASGATVDFPTGSNITIAGDVNTATIETPGGGFVNDNDLINKFYVDSVAQGLDWKESVRIATLAGEDLTAGSFGGTYTAGGGPTATGEFTLVDLSSATGGSIDGVFFTGVAGTGLVVGDRVLIKNQADPKQNGIYEITAGPAGSATLTRAEDQDGSPASEVSGGNTVFVEDTGLGSGVNENTAWAVVFDGNVTLNTDNVDWTQTAGPGAVVAGIGISRDANTLDLDVDDLVAATPVKTDVFAFHDADGTPESSGSITRKVTFEDAFSDLGVPFDLTGTGIVVKLTEGSPDTYTTRTLAINGGGPLDGLALASPDGTAGNPTFGLNITGLPVRSDAVDTADRVAVWNSTANANEYYTIGEISTASASMSFSTWTPAGNSTGGSIVADTANDTVTVTGGPGILITTTPASDTIEWEIDISTLSAGTTVALTDEIAVDQGADPNVRFTFTDMVQDLDIVHGITSNGLIRRTANDTYEQIAIVESTTAGQEGGQVNNGGTGDTGNIEIGVDINNLGNSADDLAATDEAIIFDGTNNVSMTGQQIADGVTNILNITGLTFTDINGQSILTYIDSVRGPNKVLSIESNTYQFSDNDLDHLSWVSIGDAVDADSGHVMPLDGTIVFATAHCENTATSATKEMHVFVDGVDAGSVGLLGPGANTEITDATIDIDFLQGQKIRVQAQNGVAGRIRDTVVDLTVRWRDV